MITVAALALVFSQLSAPAPLHVKAFVDPFAGTRSTRDSAIASLHEGLWADSLVRPGPPGDPNLGVRGASNVIVIDGAVERSASGGYDVRLQVFSMLGRRLAGPDTVRIEPAQLGKVFFEYGRWCARLLATPQGRSGIDSATKKRKTPARFVFVAGARGG